MHIKNFNPTETAIYQLVKPITDSLELSVWDVTFAKEGSDYYLRVYIDSEDGITLDDCEAVSRPLSSLLDDSDPIENSYFLEISSPGIDREISRLWHFEYAAGKTVKIKTIRPKNELRDFEGILTEFNKECLTLDSITSFEFKEIANIYLLIIPEEIHDNER